MPREFISHFLTFHFYFKMLSSNKLNYIEGVQKHAKRVATTTIVLSVIVLTILIVIHTIINHRKLADIIYNPFFSVIVLILFFFFILYRGKQRALKLQKLIEQMSEEEFQFLLQIQSSLSFHYKHAPTFVLCCEQLYLFTPFKIKNIDPKKVEKVRWHYARGGSLLVEIQSPETTKFEVYNSVYPYFASLIGWYNPNADIEKYE